MPLSSAASVSLTRRCRCKRDLPANSSGHDPHAKMALAGARRAAVAGMQVRFIDRHRDASAEMPAELLADGRFDGHLRTLYDSVWQDRRGYGPGTTVEPIAQRRPCARRGLRTYSADNEVRLEILRLRPRQAGPRAGGAPGGAGLPVEGLHRRRRSTVRPGGVDGRASITCSASSTCASSMPPTITSQGMSNADIEAYQKDSVTGHRPTWKAGANSWAHGTRHGMGDMHGSYGRRFSDPHGFFSWRSADPGESATEPQALGAQVARIARFDGAGGPATRSRRGSRSWSNATTPTPTVGTKGPKTSCAKSSKLITISSRLGSSEA